MELFSESASLLPEIGPGLSTIGAYTGKAVKEIDYNNIKKKLKEFKNIGDIMDMRDIVQNVAARLRERYRSQLICLNTASSNGENGPHKKETSRPVESTKISCFPCSCRRNSVSLHPNEVIKNLAVFASSAISYKLKNEQLKIRSVRKKDRKDELVIQLVSMVCRANERSIDSQCLSVRVNAKLPVDSGSVRKVIRSFYMESIFIFMIFKLLQEEIKSGDQSNAPQVEWRL